MFLKDRCDAVTFLLKINVSALFITAKYCFRKKSVENHISNKSCCVRKNVNFIRYIYVLNM